MEFIFPLKAIEADTASEDEDETSLKVRLFSMVASVTRPKNKLKEKENCGSQRPSR